MPMMERVKAICLKPNAEWPVIDGETTSTRDLMVGYAVPLAAIGPIASFVGGVAIGRTIPFIGTYHVPVGSALTLAVVSYVLSLVGIFVLSLIVNALAPSFGGQKNSAQALKVAVYAYTPAWIGGIFTILFSLSFLAIVAGLYGIYLFYLGLPILMKSPKEKSAGYTVVVILCAIVLYVVIGAVVGAVGGAGMLAAGGMKGLSHAGGAVAPGQVQFDKDSLLGRMQAMGQAAQEQSKRMEEARKSGDPNAQAQAAMQGMAAILGGGKRVDPIGIDQLKPFVPQMFAGLPKTGGSAEKNGVAGFAVSKAEGSYGDHGQKHVTLEITDTGGASGLMGLATWANVQGEHEDDNGFEKTDKVDGRLVHEKGSKRPGGSNEFTVVLGERFIVAARGSGVELSELKAAVSGLDLGKLEGLKSAGVQQ
ncbi:MAG TPA: Yip1 family protein [Polyangia bacterium]|nr:Yip1 family protein [Polyangia bacterium]